MNDGLNSDILLDRLVAEIENLDKQLTMEVDNMSKKELKRLANNLRSVLIGTLEFPIRKTQEVDDGISKIIDQCISIRQLHTALALHVIGEGKSEEENE